MGGLVSCSCRNKEPQIGTTNIVPLPVLETKSLKSSCWQATPSAGSGESPPASSSFHPQQLLAVATSPCSLPLSPHVLSGVSVSKFPPSSKDTSHWIQDPPKAVQPPSNVTVPAKTLFPKKVTVTGRGKGGTIQPITISKPQGVPLGSSGWRWCRERTRHAGR